MFGGMPRDASHEVSGSFSTVQRVESTGGDDCSTRAPGFASPGSFRPQGFAPSRRVPPRQACPALFHAGALLEFLTLQSLFLVRSRCASRRSLPSCPSPGPCVRRTFALGSADPAGCRRRTAAACGFKALLPGASSSRHPLFVRRTERSMLSWVSGPFRVLPHRPCADVSPRGSSLELSIRASAAVVGPKPDHDGATLHRLPGVFTRPGLAVLSSARQTLLGFPTSSIASPIREPPRPGSWFHLGRRTTSPLRGQSLFGRF
jgi:hypothetical protein